ncbi:MAG: helix-turn-helix transcriptional regulator [Dehalococcoidales bacterium]|nr:helix-turn-helix transcriptional regulator [Dehalococcoidales bacterium]
MVKNKEQVTFGTEEQAAIFSILGDCTRLKLLKLLAQQQEPNALCVNALAHHLGVTQSAVSQHLKVLKSAGLVKGKRRGYRIHYFINHEAMKKAQQQISEALPIDGKPSENIREVTD